MPPTIYPNKIKTPQTKTALHRTRLRFLDRVNFFYKPDRQTAPVLAACANSPTEKIEKNFSIFQFRGSRKERVKFVTFRYKRIFLILREFVTIKKAVNLPPKNWTVTRADAVYRAISEYKETEKS